MLSDDVMVIPRADVPAIYEIEEGGKKHSLGEHRDFSRHPVLKGAIPDNARLGISWATLTPGQVLEPHLHPILSMIIVCRGAGELLGDKLGSLHEGDVVVVPPGRLHGFVGSGPEGLTVLSVQFNSLNGDYRDLTTKATEKVLDQLFVTS